MKAHEITEAPVVGSEYGEEPDRKTVDSSFDGIDDKKVSSPIWRESLIGKWKDPRDFYLFFFKMSKDNWNYWNYRHGEFSKILGSINSETTNILPTSSVSKLKSTGFKPKPDAINIVYLGNEIDNITHGLTPWMLAHRVCHATALEWLHDKRLEDIFINACKKHTGEKDKYQAVYEVMINYGTFGSARRKTLSWVEGIIEAFTQKIVMGEFALTEKAPEELRLAAKKLDQFFDMKLDSFVGNCYAI